MRDEKCHTCGYTPRQQEEIIYQVKLIQKDKLRERKGHLSLTERDKITILYGEGLSIRKIASI